MDLKTARGRDDAHPAIAHRIAALTGQIDAFRRDFYDHVMNLERLDAASKTRDLTDEETAIQAKMEGELDDLDLAIATTAKALTALQRQEKAAEAPVPRRRKA